MADEIRNVVQAQTLGKDYSPQTGQQVLNIDANRVRVLGTSQVQQSGGATVTVAAVAGMSPVITQILGSAASTPTGSLIVTEDIGGTPNVLLTLHPKVTDLNIPFQVPLKGSLVGKTLTVAWVTGGSVATDLQVLGFFE